MAPKNIKRFVVEKEICCSHNFHLCKLSKYIFNDTCNLFYITNNFTVVLPSKLVVFEAYGYRIYWFDHQEVHAVSKNGTVGTSGKRMYD